jgi:hypothetical protein
MRSRWKKMIYIAPLALVGIAVFIAIGGEVVMQLWNWLLPSLFEWRTITFWQAVGLLALCRILFGGLGRHGSHGSGFRRRMYMKGRCQQMTPDERERFRQGIREGWGFGPNARESKE